MRRGKLVTDDDILAVKKLIHLNGDPKGYYAATIKSLQKKMETQYNNCPLSKKERSMIKQEQDHETGV